MRHAGPVVALLFLVACNGAPTQAPASHRAAPVSAVAVDARGVPSLLHAHGPMVQPGATATEAARRLVEELAPVWRVRALPVLESAGEIAVPGGTIARLRQSLDGMPVWGRELRVLVRGHGGASELVAVRGTPVDAGLPRSAVFRSSDDEAIARAVSDRSGSTVRIDQARALRRWYAHGDRLVAAWVVECFTSRPGSTTGDAFRTVIAGDDGRVLARTDLVADDSFTYRVFAEQAGERHPFDGPIEDSSPNRKGVPDGSFPAFVSPALVTVESLNTPPGGAVDPWLVAGATTTVGNNVDAYADFNAPNGLSAGDFRAATTSPGTFDHTYDTALEPMASQSQQMAAITALFYTLNWLHDFWYDAGFTEVAGNAQGDNYGRGGDDGDRLLAEAQDNAINGSRNNANMATPGDGMSPRMQVFLWTGDDERSLLVQPANRSPDVGTASFGPGTFDTTAEVVLGVDDAIDVNDACSALTNDVAGKIVLINRGTCSFESKVLRVQEAGGVGALVANNINNPTPPAMPGDAQVTTPITIGALSITMAEGAQLKADLLAGAVTATLHRVRSTELDGGLDATVVAHEYGHYLHHRLSECETTEMCRAMSEGWGDFVALLLMSREGDDPAGAYPFAVYATRGFSADAAYFGIRRAPYSTDLAINGLSFRHMTDGEPLPANQPFLDFSTNSEVHNAGEVWAAMLWDAYQAILARGPTFAEARAKMARYVVAGLLMAPAEASPIEVRDALLAVIRAADAGDHDAVMAAFARRGMGSCAVAPPRLSTDFAGIVESDEVAGFAQIGAATLDDSVATCDGDGILDSGETARLTVPLTNAGHAPLTDVRMTLSSSTTGITIASPEAAIAMLAPNETVMVTFDIAYAGAGAPAMGTFDVALAATSGGCGSLAPPPITVRLDIDDVPARLATDTFDAATSVWTVTGTSGELWTHERKTALDGHWHGADPGFQADIALVSPPLQADDETPVVVGFTHVHAFESSATDDFDGGVVEISLDGGGSWQDVSTVGTIAYTGTLSNLGGNPLGGRQAFTRRNPSHPSADHVSIDFGTNLAGKSFLLRFRIGTDANAGAEGWDIDEIAFGGIIGTPFPAQADDTTVCGVEPPPPGDDGGCCGAGPMRPSNAAAGLLVALLLLRRRRR
jgi:hypothetical protein